VIDGRLPKGRSGNPGGRPLGLARKTRELVGGDGERIVNFWIDTMEDPTCRRAERLEASRLLAERGWGKTASFEFVEKDEEDQSAATQEQLNVAVDLFDAEVVRLAVAQRQSGAALTLEPLARFASGETLGPQESDE
jgi:hypothetical protein